MLHTLVNAQNQDLAEVKVATRIVDVAPRAVSEVAPGRNVLVLMENDLAALVGNDQVLAEVGAGQGDLKSEVILVQNRIVKMLIQKMIMIRVDGLCKNVEVPSSYRYVIITESYISIAHCDV